jgi:thioredoxin reductase (NADPH)
MAVIALDSQESGAYLRRWVERAPPVVVALCAAWCDTCTEFRATLERIAAARPELLFFWLDIEDDAAICGDIDVENFPTLAIYRGEHLLHYGVALPLEGTIGRLVDEIVTRPEVKVPAPPAVLELPQRLRARLPDQAA